MVRNIGKDASERKVLEDIAEYGWHCVNIFAEDDLPPYSFTVGVFDTYKHPELIIFGLPREVASGPHEKGSSHGIRKPARNFVGYNPYLGCIVD
jgi:hypothetical protein